MKKPKLAYFLKGLIDGWILRSVDYSNKIATSAFLSESIASYEGKCFARVEKLVEQIKEDIAKIDKSYYDFLSESEREVSTPRETFYSKTMIKKLRQEAESFESKIRQQIFIAKTDLKLEECFFNQKHAAYIHGATLKPVSADNIPKLKDAEIFFDDDFTKVVSTELAITQKIREDSEKA